MQRRAATLQDEFDILTLAGAKESQVLPEMPETAEFPPFFPMLDGALPFPTRKGHASGVRRKTRESSW
jgi:hypothetical protein